MAALTVLVSHAYQLSGSYRHPDVDEFKRVLIGGSGVWLFFALSGYLITGPFVRALITGAPLPGLLGYGIRRSTRIFPAYFAALTVVILFGLAARSSLQWWQYPLHYSLLHNSVPGEEQAVFGVSWTLTLEILFYALVPVMAWAARRAYCRPIPPRYLSASVLALWATSIVWTLGAPIAGDATTSLWLRQVLPSMLSMFCPGILVAIAVATWRARGTPPPWFVDVCTHRRLTLVAICGLLSLGVVGTVQIDHVRVHDLSRQCYAIAFGLVVALAVTRRELVGSSGRVLAWLGLISYGIYLWHGALLQVIERHGVDGWVPLPHGGSVAFIVHTLYLLALTIPVAWLSWILIERPAMYRARRWLDRRRIDSL
jgi:peptidoglycan/LPS O-acetylase OafA/YrhL